MRSCARKENLFGALTKFLCRNLFGMALATNWLWIAVGAAAQDLPGGPFPNASSLGALTCQQLWHLEQEVLAEGRVCLKSARAQRAFSSAPACVSAEERILPIETRGYLAEVRKVSLAKNCR